MMRIISFVILNNNNMKFVYKLNIYVFYDFVRLFRVDILGNF